MDFRSNAFFASRSTPASWERPLPPGPSVELLEFESELELEPELVSAFVLVFVFVFEETG